MRRRLYFLLPDVKSARQVFKKLLLARIEDRHIFFLAKEGVELSDLPEATMLQKSDEIHGLGVGLVVGGRINGVLISNGNGMSVAYALFNLQERGRMFVGPGEDMYEGMIIGIHTRDNDLVVNAMKGKQLTNMRASGSDENVILVPPIELTLERAIEFIDDDELVEITPNHLRLRKRFLKETDRKRADRAAAG